MPSFVASPLQIRFTGGDAQLIPARFTGAPLTLSFTGGAGVMGPGTGTVTLTELTLKLDRLQRQTGYFDAQGRPTAQMQLLWQRHCEALEAFARRISAAVTDNANMLAQILATQQLAQAANDNAVAVSEAQDLADSYTDPTSVVTAASDGTVTIAAHNRVYPVSGVSVAIDSGGVSGFASGDYVTVFYNDAAREGGAVMYQATTSAKSQEGSTHIVGSVSVPQSGDPPQEGSSPSAPGYTPPPQGLPGTDYQ